jgi:hypothetical protein
VGRSCGGCTSHGGLALGAVEVLLGVLLFFAREDDLHLITIVVAVWGFVGGSLLLIEGIGLRRIARAGDLGER